MSKFQNQLQPLCDPDKKEIDIGLVCVANAVNQDFSDRDICLFLTYSPDGKVGEGVHYLANSIKQMGVGIVLCVVTENINLKLEVFREDTYSLILSRRNGGYDFAMWAAALKMNSTFWRAKRIFFVNDSLLGPISALDEMMNRIRSSNADFIALTANEIGCYHAQSYFFVLQGTSLKSRAVRDFWESMPEYSSKLYVIRNCEQMQLSIYVKAGLKYEILFDVDDILLDLNPSERMLFNPTKDAWQELLKRGFPFIKADLVTKWHIPINRLFPVDQGLQNILRLQINESTHARFKPEIDEKHKHLGIIKKIVGKRIFFYCRAWLKRRNAMKRLRQGKRWD